MQTEIKVGVNLKRLRQEKGWSLDKTAKATGVSKAMLGQIERGESSPTVAKLWQIASGFEVSLSSFIAASSNSELTSLFRDANELRHEEYNIGFFVSLLFPFEEALGFEIFELTLAPDYHHESEPHNAGALSTFYVFRERWLCCLMVSGKRYDQGKPFASMPTRIMATKMLGKEMLYSTM